MLLTRREILTGYAFLSIEAAAAAAVHAYDERVQLFLGGIGSGILAVMTGSLASWLRDRDIKKQLAQDTPLDTHPDSTHNLPIPRTRKDSIQGEEKVEEGVITEEEPKEKSEVGDRYSEVMGQMLT